MCRWFAYVSPGEDCLLEDVLVTPAHSLAKQVNEHYLPKLLHNEDAAGATTEREIALRNRLLNVDGLGLAWYTDVDLRFGGGDGPRPALYKTTQPPLHDTNFRSICANTATRACLAHIRAATATAITPVNNHPFVFGRHALMHNGFISDFLAIRRDMTLLMDDDAFANIDGSTDSEHFAALYMTHLAGGRGKAGWDEQYSTEHMHVALQRTVDDLIQLQRTKLGPDRAQPSSLNVAATDGERLVAYRFRNHATEQPPSLYYSINAGATLNRKYPDHPDAGRDNPRQHLLPPEQHGRHVIVASEPCTYRECDWTLLGKNICLAVEADGSLELRNVLYPADYTVNEGSGPADDWVT
ncbi:MAG: hypothetical protein M1832_002249 [Thelocarpon impressellum]|nr:MAG: hypothetical protein M1832_002249 [Thelocarpon impressellum]